MLRAKKVGLLVKIALLILLAYLIITLVNVRRRPRRHRNPHRTGE